MPEGPVSNPQSDIDETLIQSEDQRRSALRRGTRGVEPPAVPGYQVLRKLGQGAYGEVWLGRDLNTSREVAIKVFFDDHGLDWPLLRREVEKLVQAVTERRVVQLLKVGWEARRPYYVMEYLPGGSLADLLDAGTVGVEETARLLQQIAEGLVFLHGKAILHCDLKPANVLLDSGGQVRLADFGQARADGEEGPAVGTFFYMPPEQASLDVTPDVRSDLYALGAVAHAMLTGAPPFASEKASRDLASSTSVGDRIERYRAILDTAEPPSAHRRVPGIDRALVDIIDRCLARDPERRFENAQQVVDALEARARSRAQRPLLAAGFFGPLVLFLALGGFGYFAFHQAESAADTALVEQSLAANLSTARVVAAAVDRNLSAIQRRVAREAQRPEWRRLLSSANLDGAGVQGQIQGMTDELYEIYRDRHFYSWVVADAQAVARARSPYDARVIGHGYAYREWFSGRVEEMMGDHPVTAVARRGVGLTLAFKSTAAGEPILVSVAAPVESEAHEAEPLGVLAATLHLETFNEWLAEAETPAAAGGCPDRFVVLLNRGQVVRHPCPGAEPGEPPVLAENYFEHPSVRQLLASEPSKHADFADPLHPEGHYLAAAQRLDENTDWIAIVMQDRGDAIAPVSSLATRMADLARFAAGVGLTVMGALWLLLWRVTKSPNRASSRSAQRPLTG